jgi:hypothetical protein
MNTERPPDTSTEKVQEYEHDLNEYRGKHIGELVRLKSRVTASPYEKALAEMEIERRVFVRDKLIDRILAVGAIIVSLIALFIRSH